MASQRLIILEKVTVDLVSMAFYPKRLERNIDVVGSEWQNGVQQQKQYTIVTVFVFSITTESVLPSILLCVCCLAMW
jgi:hypothetical protein